MLEIKRSKKSDKMYNVSTLMAKDIALDCQDNEKLNLTFQRLTLSHKIARRKASLVVGLAEKKEIQKKTKLKLIKLGLKCIRGVDILQLYKTEKNVYKIYHEFAALAEEAIEKSRNKNARDNLTPSIYQSSKPKNSLGFFKKVSLRDLQQKIYTCDWEEKQFEENTKKFADILFGWQPRNYFSTTFTQTALDQDLISHIILVKTYISGLGQAINLLIKEKAIADFSRSLHKIEANTEEGNTKSLNSLQLKCVNAYALLMNKFQELVKTQMITTTQSKIQKTLSNKTVTLIRNEFIKKVSSILNKIE